MRARSFTIEDADGVEVHTGVDVTGYVTGWHFHEEWQVVSVAEGERRFEFRDGEVRVARGSTIAIPPRTVHRGFGGRASFSMWYVLPPLEFASVPLKPAVAAMSPRACRIQHRLNEARRLLHREHIADVASALGFADQSHFGRQFKRAFGLTPGLFVRLHRGT